MHLHALVSFSVLIYGRFSGTQSLPFEIEVRERRSPQQGGLFFQTSGSLNLNGLNLPQVASNVRRRLQDLIAVVKNPITINVMTQVDSVDTDGEFDFTNQYQVDGQQFQNSQAIPFKGPPRHSPHKHLQRGHPHDYMPGSPSFQENDSSVYTIPSSETQPNFNDEQNYAGKGNLNSNMNLSNQDVQPQQSTKADSEVVEYIEDNFPVILLNENEIR